MPRTQTADTSIEIDLADETATADLAAALARIARPGDVLALSGDLGTGKTTFARAFIRAVGATQEEVPSPTFTLAQIYEAGTRTVYHFDLFRLSAPEETEELGMDDAFADGISLIEWPDRLGPRLPAERLDVALAMGAHPRARRVRLTGHGGWRRRLEDADLG